MTCKHEWDETTITSTVTVSEHDFTRMLAAKRCRRCSETRVSGDVLEAFELGIARPLYLLGVRTGSAFRYARKSLGLKVHELADAVGVSPMSIQLWENGSSGKPFNDDPEKYLASEIERRLTR